MTSTAFCTCFCFLLYVNMIVECEFVPPNPNSNLTLVEAIRRQEEIDQSNVTNVLSRRRRYLVFPEGSSLQVVFCLTYTTNIMIGDIFYMGATAALAWQLPQEPYSPFKLKPEAIHRKDDGQIEYIDKKNGEKYPNKQILVNRFTGQPIQPQTKKQFIKKYDTSYKKYWSGKQIKRKKFLVNPALAKRSVKDDETKKKSKNKREAIMKIDRKVMHKIQENRDYLKTDHMDWKNIEYHRISRSKLYEKIEKLLRGMGHDGRQCVLKALCEMGQDDDKKQGSFLDEIMKAIFTLPKGDIFESTHHRAYDEAHYTKDNCDELYPKCKSTYK